MKQVDSVGLIVSLVVAKQSRPKLKSFKIDQSKLRIDEKATKVYE